MVRTFIFHLMFDHRPKEQLVKDQDMLKHIHFVEDVEEELSIDKRRFVVHVDFLQKR